MNSSVIDARTFETQKHKTMSIMTDKIKHMHIFLQIMIWTPENNSGICIYGRVDTSECYGVLSTNYDF